MEHDGEIGSEAVLSDVEIAFTSTPALNRSLSENSNSRKFKYQEQHELNALAECGHEKLNANDRNNLGTKTRLSLMRVEEMLPQGTFSR